MAFPAPVPGLVIRYSYLRAVERARVLEEGLKDRPATVVVAATGDEGEQVVTVLPITHRPPLDPSHAVEIPEDTKRRLGLDDARSWVVLTEANRFIWPGPDLRPGIAGDAGRLVHGQLPHGLFERIRLGLIAAIRAKQSRPVLRDE